MVVLCAGLSTSGLKLRAEAHRLTASGDFFKGHAPQACGPASALRARRMRGGGTNVQMIFASVNQLSGVGAGRSQFSASADGAHAQFFMNKNGKFESTNNRDVFFVPNNFNFRANKRYNI